MRDELPLIVVTVVADLICPWCYIGRARLRTAARLLEGELVIEQRHHPFELNPNMPADGMARRDYRTQKFGSWQRSLELDAQVTAAARAHGLPIALDRQERTPNSFLAHRLALHHQGGAAGDALLDALYHAYFSDGRDIGRPDVLTTLASEVGLDGNGAATLLANDEGALEVRAAIQAAYDAGIGGVPAFIASNQLLSSGAEAPAVLADRLRRVASESSVARSSS